MNENIFNTSIHRLMVLLLPTPLRKDGIITLLDAMATPFAILMDKIRAWHKQTKHRALYNGQVCRMEMMLNDQLDEDGRGIRVIDGDVITGAAVLLQVREHDGAPTPKRRGDSDNAVILPSRAASTKTKYDFTVLIPERIMQGLQPQENDSKTQTLIALVNTYKLPSTKWNWQTYGPTRKRL